MADLSEAALGNWLDAAALRARYSELPTGALGDDLAAAAYEECVQHLGSIGKTVPENGAVPASYRQAQVLFAKTLNSARATNADSEESGLPGSQVPLYSWRKRARDLLGSGFLVG